MKIMNEAKYITQPPTGLSGSGDRSFWSPDHLFSPPDFAHIPVMAEIVTETFSTVPSGPILDATIGGGGHSYEILKSRDDLNVIGIDQDPEALAAAKSKLAGFENRVSSFTADSMIFQLLRNTSVSRNYQVSYLIWEFPHTNSTIHTEGFIQKRRPS